jgi:CelD/BcsL family acetyltransferase involved in cellulose biosynthesis
VSIASRAALPEEQIDQLAADWDALVDRVEGEPWHRPGWFRAYWRAFGGEAELRLVEVRRDGRLAALVPLEHRRRGWDVPANWHSPTASLLAEDEEARRELVARVLELRPSFLTARFLDPSELPAIVGAARDRGYRTLDRTVMRSPYVPTTGDLDDLWQTVDVKKSPRELARREKKLAKDFTVEFHADDGADGFEDTIVEGLITEGSGWKVDLGTAIVSRPDTLQFYTEMSRWARDRGELRMFYYVVEGKMASFELCLETNGRLNNIKGGINPDYRKWAVGVLTQFQMIKHCFSNGLDSFEFLGGEAPHKRDWTDIARDRSLVQAFRSDALGLGAYGAFAYGRPLAKRALELAHSLRSRSAARDP